MKIGKALKEERLKRNLSIRKMAAEIIDPSFYAKVEKEDRHIGADPLIRILFKHNIDIDGFFQKIKVDYASDETIKKEKLTKKIKKSFNTGNLAQVRAFKREILKLNDAKVLQLSAIVAEKYLENRKVESVVVSEIYHELDRLDDLGENIDAIRLFSNTLPVYTDEQLNFFMKEILIKAEKRDEITEKEEEQIVILCSNYLHACYERHINNQLVRNVYSYLKNTNKIHFMIYKCAGEIDKNLIDGNQKQAKKIKSQLLALGYEEVRLG